MRKVPLSSNKSSNGNKNAVLRISNNSEGEEEDQEDDGDHYRSRRQHQLRKGNVITYVVCLCFVFHLFKNFTYYYCLPIIIINNNNK